jgi:hypothetical protein
MHQVDLVGLFAWLALSGPQRAAVVGLRPIFHHKEVRADGHLFITVLAYQLVQLIPPAPV